MYTEFHYCCELNVSFCKENNIFELLEYMLDNDEKCPEKLPDHPFFKGDESRWRFMLNMGSAYFTAIPCSTLTFIDDTFKKVVLFIHCNFKNYTNEINEFLDWIEPYVVALPGQFMGYQLYEEWKEPALIFHKEEIRYPSVENWYL